MTKKLTDLQLVATLQTNGIDWDRIETRSRQIIFCYDNEKLVEPYINSYYTGKMKVEAKSLFNNYDDIKTFVKQQ